MGEVHGRTGVTAIRKAFLADGLQTWSRATVGLGPKNKRYLLPTGSDLPPSTNVLSFSGHSLCCSNWFYLPNPSLRFSVVAELCISGLGPPRLSHC